MNTLARELERYINDVASHRKPATDALILEIDRRIDKRIQQALKEYSALALAGRLHNG